MTGEGRPRIVESTEVVANDRLAEGVGLVTLDAPRIARDVEPGQFVHLRIEEGASFILRRPFSVHRVLDGRIQLLYQVLGTGTRALAGKEPGDVMDAVGPLGHGFEVPEGTAHALLVAGGLGVAPMVLLAERLAERGVAATVAYGAPERGRLVARGALEAVARRVEVATDDGSAGAHGLVTELVGALIEDDDPDVVYTCGPEVMSRAVARIAAEADLPCKVSLERLMACGVGACLSCVVTTTAGQARACVDGPVFDAHSLAWDAGERP
jgi:dihydroorotate dehydrogenase electron transfer subunit